MIYFAENSNSSIVLTLILSVLRGHLKSSHIADKRKIFHMALYPSLPPQTKVLSTIGVMYGRWRCTSSSFFPTTCPNGVVCVMQTHFPGCSASIVKWTRRQPQRKKRILLVYFFCCCCFSARSKRAASVDLQCWTGGSACHCLFSAFNLAFKSQSIFAMDRLQLHACTSRLFASTCSSSCNDLRHFPGDLLWSAIAAARWVAGRACFFFFFFFFFFFLLSIAQRIGSKPLPPIWKFFRLSAMCEYLRWPLTPNLPLKTYARASIVRLVNPSWW